MKLVEGHAVLCYVEAIKVFCGVFPRILQRGFTENWAKRLMRPISQIPQCIRQLSHNALFCNRNVKICAHFYMCTFLLQNGDCGIWDWCVVGCVHVQQVWCDPE